MAPIDWSWGEAYASPTLIAPTHPTSDFAQPANASAPQNAPTDLALQWQTPNSSQQTSIQAYYTHHKTSRKRSRDEMADGSYDNDDSDSSRVSTTPFRSARPTPSPPKQDHQAQAPVLGPGMTLVYPSAEGGEMQMMGAHLDPASQTGTWAEELSERLRSSSMREQQQQQQQQMQTQPPQRPSIESRKSMRLNHDATEQGSMDDVHSSTSAHVSTSEVKADTGIDEAALTLGIGWSTVPSNSTMGAASRGWARHIEAHFPLQSARIVWTNKSLPAYLVSAVTCDTSERSTSPSSQSGFGSLPDRPSSPWNNPVGSPGYYLFDGQFGQGRLVAKSWERALGNLRQAPLAFDGAQVMQSAEIAHKPKPIQAQYWAGWAGMRTGGLSASAPSSTLASPSPGIAIEVGSGGRAGDSMDVDM